MNASTLTQLQIVVERAVRPVRAGARRKDRMREELLAHLTGIYDQERARHGDETAAREEAVRRFGQPAALTRGLQESLTGEDRLTYFVERWIGWRARESAARHAYRLAVTVLVCLAAMALPMVVAGVTERLVNQRGVQELPRLLLNVAVLLGMGTGALFVLGLLYFKLRDTLFASRGVSRSLLRVAAYAAFFSLVVLALPVGMLLVPMMGTAVSADLDLCLEILWPWWFVFALVSPLFPVLYARIHGPTEIRHAEWACLDLGE
jgi:hypothetical protein